MRLKLSRADLGNGLAEPMVELLAAHRDGSCPVAIDYTGEGARAELTLGPDWRVHPTEALLDELRRLVGTDRVEMDFR
jgi:DNA polymerase-3 subunit alpha